jgi:hypothetical protein
MAGDAHDRFSEDRHRPPKLEAKAGSGLSAAIPRAGLAEAIIMSPRQSRGLEVVVTKEVMA